MSPNYIHIYKREAYSIHFVTTLQKPYNENEMRTKLNTMKANYTYMRETYLRHVVTTLYIITYGRVGPDSAGRGRAGQGRAGRAYNTLGDDA